MFFCFWLLWTAVLWSAMQIASQKIFSFLIIRLNRHSSLSKAFMSNTCNKRPIKYLNQTAVCLPSILDETRQRSVVPAAGCPALGAWLSAGGDREKRLSFTPSSRHRSSSSMYSSTCTSPDSAADRQVKIWVQNRRVKTVKREPEVPDRAASAQHLIRLLEKWNF